MKMAMSFPGGSDGKESAGNAGDLVLIPVSGKPPGKGNGNSLQYSCLENLMDRGYSPWGQESDMTEQLTQHFMDIYYITLCTLLYLKILHKNSKQSLIITVIISL